MAKKVQLQDIDENSLIISQATELTYNELVELRNNSQLVAGAIYIITDYEFTTSVVNTTSGGHNFDIIVVADNENTLSEFARARRHEGDTYYEYSNLSAWELKYSLDNDTSRFEWADEVNGKGVIYYMKDEWNNEVPYDFKNLIYQVKKGFVYNHTGVPHTFNRNEALDTIIDGVQYYGYTTKAKPTSFPTINCLVKDDIVTSSTILYNLDGSTAPNYGSTITNINTEEYDYYTFNYSIKGMEDNFEVTAKNYIVTISGLFSGFKENKITEFKFINCYSREETKQLILNHNIFEYAASFNKLENCKNNVFYSQCGYNTLIYSSNNTFFKGSDYNELFYSDGNTFGDNSSRCKLTNSSNNKIEKYNCILSSGCISNSISGNYSTIKLNENVSGLLINTGTGFDDFINIEISRISGNSYVATYINKDYKLVSKYTVDGGTTWLDVEETGGSSIPDDRVYLDLSSETNINTVGDLITKLTDLGYLTENNKPYRFYLILSAWGNKYIFDNITFTLMYGTYTCTSIKGNKSMFSGEVNLERDINMFYTNDHSDFLTSNTYFITQLVARIEALENK